MGLTGLDDGNGVGPPYPRVPYVWFQPNTDEKYSKKYYIVADMYYVFRPMMVACTV